MNENQYFQIFGLKLNRYEQFLLEVVDRVSETQLQMGGGGFK